VTWSSSATSVATVDGSGKVTGVAQGSATISATAGGQSGKATVTVVPDPPVNSSPSGVLAAFPGARGWGAQALSQCSRTGMQVVHVTNLGDSGPGTLRNAMGQARDDVLTVIVFDVSGYITLGSRIELTHSCLYIAGQTAPGGGITIRAPDIQAILFAREPVHDVVIRYLRFRNGTNQPGTHTNSQGMIIGVGQRVVLDHLSFSWANDQLLSIYKYPLGWGPVRDITVQRSLFAEPFETSPVCYTTKGDVNDPTNGWYAVTGVSLHHNVAIDCNHRAPQNTAHDAEVINNVVYNYQTIPMEVDRKTYEDVIGNYFKAGPMNYSTDAAYGHEVGHEFSANKPGGWSGSEPDGYVVMGNTNNIDGRCGFGIYMDGNVGPHNPDGSKDQWLMTSKKKNDYLKGPFPESFSFYTSIVYSNSQDLNLPLSINGCSFRRTSRLPQSPIPVPVESAASAWQALVVNGDVGDNRRLTCTGDWTGNADAVDSRVLAQAEEGTGPGRGGNPLSAADVGGFPSLSAGTPCADSDADGMPDAFETRYGLDGHSAADAADDSNGDGYSNLEEFLNGRSPR